VGSQLAMKILGIIYVVLCAGFIIGAVWGWYD
jgi:hypothetical protein